MTVRHFRGAVVVVWRQSATTISAVDEGKLRKGSGEATHGDAHRSRHCRGRAAAPRRRSRPGSSRSNPRSREYGENLAKIDAGRLLRKILRMWCSISVVPCPAL